MIQHEVAILGSGPAGLGLARALVSRGTRVICISPEVHQAWPQNFGVWGHELGDALKNAVEASWDSASVWTGPDETVLAARYCRIDTARLQVNLKTSAEAMGLVFVDDAAVAVTHDTEGSTVQLASGQEIRTRFVVDATGHQGLFLERESSEDLAYQTAFGQVLEVDAHPLLDGEMVFMDLRSLPDDDELAPPTFLYAMPLGPQRIFVEETSLVSAPPVPISVLQERLAGRLDALGVRGGRPVDEERCKFPLNLGLPSLRQRTLGFGLAAGMVHPASGYQLARSLNMADDIAQAISEGLEGGDLDEHAARVWRAIWPKDDVLKWELFGFGSRFLQTLNPEQSRQFFEAFFSLTDADWRGYLSGTTSMANVASVMAKVFYRLGPTLRWKLMRRGVSLDGLSLLSAAVSR